MPEKLLALARGAPWWARTVLGGLSAGAALATAFGIGAGPRGERPRIATSGISLDAVKAQEADRGWRTQTDATLSQLTAAVAEQARADREWRAQTDALLHETIIQLRDTRERLARIEGRLDEGGR